MRRLALIATGFAAVLAAPTVAQADSFNAGVYANGRGGVGINLGYSTGNRGGYPYGGYGRGVPVGVPVYGVPVPQTVFVPIQSATPRRTTIVREDCDPGYKWNGRQCVGVFRIR